MKSLKTIIFTGIALLFVGQAFAQRVPEKPFVLEARLSGNRIDSVLVSYFTEGKYKVVTLPVNDQKFTVRGTMDIPETVTVIFKNKGEMLSRIETEKRRLVFYIEPKTITLSGDAARLKEMKISGSKTQLEFEELNAALAKTQALKQVIYDELTAEKDHEKQADIREKLEPLNNAEKKIAYNFFLTHPSSYVTLDRMRYYVSAMKLDSVKRMYNKLSEQLKQTNNGKYIADEINKMDMGVPGSIATTFEATDLNGNALSLANFKGKYVILDFWASWCVPCRRGNPHLINLYKQYHDKGLEIIGISDDDRAPDAWKAAIAKDGIGIWNHVLRGLDMQLALKRLPNIKDINQKYGIHSLPTKILIDPLGKIIGRYGDSIGDSDADMDKMLVSVFKN